MAALRAYIQSIEIRSDVEAYVVAVVTDDVRKVVVDKVVSSIEELKHFLSLALDKVETLSELRTLQPNDVIDLTPAKSSDQPGATFFAAWSVLQSELAKVDAGILAPDDKRVTNARAAAQSVDDAAYQVGRR